MTTHQNGLPVLNHDELINVLKRALNERTGLGDASINADDAALALIVMAADGDARRREEFGGAFLLTFELCCLRRFQDCSTGTGVELLCTSPQCHVVVGKDDAPEPQAVPVRDRE